MLGTQTHAEFVHVDGLVSHIADNVMTTLCLRTHRCVAEPEHVDHVHAFTRLYACGRGYHFFWS